MTNYIRVYTLIKGAVRPHNVDVQEFEKVIEHY